ncbi:polyphosphate:AMP phosphotransferase [Methanoregula sp.]|uniref:polyphosphate:AMP phosphotransferase n=1 Tax=Methanoregula sp. TaxID=2052170 RepID=UPI002CAC6570|nr:polyphosphate:AMP phosphotransferase [Methanoregula sp.]HVP96855.1 polyphosphate:AMP phosphotransferase [Methanoregula sp.]
MLKNVIQPKNRIDKKTFDKKIAPLQERLGILQRSLRDARIPVIIVMEGWDAAGITRSTQMVIQSLDPRGFTLHTIEQPTDNERVRPFMWRFWIRLPPRGRIAIFARSWYSRAISAEMQRASWTKSLAGRIIAINNFERQLADDGTVILKFFLHIDKDEQQRRFIARESDPLKAWMVTPALWDLHRNYENSLPVIEDLLKKTDTAPAPWHILDATDENHAILEIYHTLVATLEKTLDHRAKKKPKKPGNPLIPEKHPVRRGQGTRAGEKTCTREGCQPDLDRLQEEMPRLQALLYKRKIPLIILYEGWDAAGKGGNITRLARNMNPRGYDVIPVSAPDAPEQSHHYLWRFVRHFPRAGHIAIFDRSWYGRVLVERVENYCTKYEWQRAYREINEMEEDFVYSTGGGIIKFWLEISRDEQLRRFEQRTNDPLKQWKITEEDWRNRENWDRYDVAIDEMLARTNTKIAPWSVIESDDKWHARVRTLEIVAEHCRKLL